MGNSRPFTVKYVETQMKPGVYRDKGNPGLLLRVEPTGAKRWVLRTNVNGRRRDLGLGSARDVSLRDAREQAAVWRRAARAGRDPTLERSAAKCALLTFAAAAEKVHAERADLWRNAKHGAQWLNTLRTYAFPVIGKMPVGDVQPADVMKVLTPIWLAKPETDASSTAHRRRAGLGDDRRSEIQSNYQCSPGGSCGTSQAITTRQAPPRRILARHPCLCYADPGTPSTEAGRFARIRLADGRPHERNDWRALGRDRYGSRRLDRAGGPHESKP